MFDVFMAHSSKDKPLIRQIYRYLKERGIQPWLDEEEIPPGTRFQEEIQQAIGQIKTAAIFIGQKGLGRWQALELESFISQCVEHNIPVIPVLLPNVEKIPENLIFLRNFHAVFFKTSIDDEKALFQLEWGITGVKPNREDLEPVVFKGVSIESSVKEKVNNSLEKFRNYLTSNGAKFDKFPKVNVKDDLPNNNIAYYDIRTDEILVIKDVVEDFDTLLREYCYKVFHRPLYEIGKGRDFEGRTIISGLGFYFPCSFKGSPFYGRSGSLTLNKKLLTYEYLESNEDESLRAVARGERWAHVLWETREKMGKEVLDKSIILAWLTLLESESPFDLEKTFIENIYKNIEKEIGGDSILFLEKKLIDWGVAAQSRVFPNVYTKLKKLLETGKWKEADEETTRLMLEIGDKEDKGYLNSDDCRNFPREELRDIDRLWLKYSNNRFGFSVQKEIYLRECGKLNYYDWDAYQKMSDINWK